MTEITTLTPQNTLAEALDVISATGIGLVPIVDSKNRLAGIATDGDLRRALLRKIPLLSPLREVMNTDPIVGKATTPPEQLAQIAVEKKTNLIVPIVNDEGELIDLFIAQPPLTAYDHAKALTPQNATIADAMRSMDSSGYGLSLITDMSNKLLGIVTNKDIRDAIIGGTDPSESVASIMNTNPLHGRVGMKDAELRLLNRTNKNLKIPLLDDQGRVKGLVQAPGEHQYASTLKRKVSRVLVTGGAGYLGSVLARILLSKGYKVVVLDNLTYGGESLKDLESNKNLRLVVGDVRHIDAITKAIKDCDAVVHLAGLVGDPACAISPTETIEQNLLSTLTLAQVCKYHQINRFVFASSCSVYGQGESILTEDSGLSPVSLYARDKIKSEESLLGLMDANFSPTILRMGTLYGMSFRPRFDLVLNIMTAKAIKEGRISVFGGDQWRPMLHVADAAEAYVKVLEADLDKVRGEVFNVGCEEENHQIVAIGRKVKELIPSAELEISDKEVDRRDYRVSFAKILRVLNYAPKRRLKEGILEIKDAFSKGVIKDYKLAKYHNHVALKENKAN